MHSLADCLMPWPISGSTTTPWLSQRATMAPHRRGMRPAYWMNLGISTGFPKTWNPRQIDSKTSAPDAALPTIRGAGPKSAIHQPNAINKTPMAGACVIRSLFHGQKASIPLVTVRSDNSSTTSPILCRRSWRSAVTICLTQ